MRKPVALLSVYNKSGIAEFARELTAHGYDLLASGGTAIHLDAAGIPVRDVKTLVGGGAILGHRVVTLSRELHASLLADPADNLHRTEMELLKLPFINLVCVDFYPLEEEIAKPDATQASVIEKTDIGGPTMLRSAAKGRRIVIADPADRMRVIDWIKQGKPEEEAFVTSLIAKAEGIVAKYCLTSARYHSKGEIDALIGTKFRELKYGENPYTKAVILKTNENPVGVCSFRQIGGMDPSMTNYLDIEALTRYLVQIAATFDINYGHVPCIAIAVKHTHACGVAIGMHPETALKKMIEGNPMAIHGGSVMTNFPLDTDLATLLRTHMMPLGDNGRPKERLLDGVCAPRFTEGADEILERKTGKCRMYENPTLANVSKGYLPRIQYKRVGGADIRQEGYPFILDLEHPLMHRGGETVTPEQRRDLLLAFAIGSVSISNTITLVKNEMLLGNGIAQPARVLAAKVALLVAHDSGHDTNGAVAYSDSFFPFPDGPLVLAEGGIRAIFSSHTKDTTRDNKIREELARRGTTLWTLPDEVCRGFKH